MYYEISRRIFQKWNGLEEDFLKCVNDVLYVQMLWKIKNIAKKFDVS